MDITAKITGIKYKAFLTTKLKHYELSNFNINNAPSTCIIKNDNNYFAISKWVSPKRTRSYPFERIYNSLSSSKKITVIPIIKDEGKVGDRDFIQWDTISLMSLLDIFVIFAFYDDAVVNPRNPQKITKQKFNNKYVISKIREIEEYHSSALHWNLKEINENFHNLIDQTLESYTKIEKRLNVELHSEYGIQSFKKRIGNDVSNFMEFSRQKAQEAQQRESITIQPKEILTSTSKAKITISNYLGGKYFFTIDQVEKYNETLYLIECKHSKYKLIPEKGDIKDGLLKMILYCNLKDVELNGDIVKFCPVLLLTSSKLTGTICSNDSKNDIDTFYKLNKFNQSLKTLINFLFKEASFNNFIVKIQAVI